MKPNWVNWPQSSAPLLKTPGTKVMSAAWFCQAEPHLAGRRYNDRFAARILTARTLILPLYLYCTSPI